MLLLATYHAAVLDTDGSVYITKDGRAGYNVEQIGAQWLQGLQRSLKHNGRFVGYVRRRAPRKGVASVVHSWTISRQLDLLRYLALLQPLVRKKKSEIDVVLRFLRGKLTTEAARKQLQETRNAYRKEEL